MAYFLKSHKEIVMIKKITSIFVLGLVTLALTACDCEKKCGGCCGEGDSCCKAACSACSCTASCGE